jgi:hypothetical protein
MLQGGGDAEAENRKVKDKTVKLKTGKVCLAVQ